MRVVIDGTGSKSCLIMGFVINSDEATDSATRVLVIRKSRHSIPDKTVNSSEYTLQKRRSVLVCTSMHVQASFDTLHICNN